MENFMESPLFQALFLAVVQGLTEFLPVSSSGHLALAEKLLPGFGQPGLLLEVILHVGTLGSIIVYYRREVLDLLRTGLSFLPGRPPAEPESKKALFGIVIASIPTAVIGLLLVDRVEPMADSVFTVGLMLMVTGTVLLTGEFLFRRVPSRPGFPGWGKSLIIGVAQGLAVIPGISRSGATISAARAMGIDAGHAASFAFLVSIPAVIGAALLTLFKHRAEITLFRGEEIAAYLVGPLVAGVVGYLAIMVVMRTLRGGKFFWFSIYCFAVGSISLFFGL